MVIVAEEDRENHGGTTSLKKWTGQSLSLLMRIADDRSQWATVTAEASVGRASGEWAAGPVLGPVTATPNIGAVDFGRTGEAHPIHSPSN